MTHWPTQSLVALEQALNLAIDDLVEHEARCAVLGPFCETCERLDDLVDAAGARLAAARSQLPDRCAFTHLRGWAA